MESITSADFKQLVSTRTGSPCLLQKTTASYLISDNSDVTICNINFRVSILLLLTVKMIDLLVMTNSGIHSLVNLPNTPHCTGLYICALQVFFFFYQWSERLMIVYWPVERFTLKMPANQKSNVTNGKPIKRACVQMTSMCGYKCV